MTTPAVPRALATLLLCAGCAEPEATQGACDHGLSPSSDDQTALQTLLIEADAGSTICLAAGTYRFETELSIAADDITLRGAGSSATVLDFSRQDLGANGIQLTGDGITLEDLAVRDTPGDGIRATAVQDVTFRRVTVSWTTPASVDNGAYGLYPVQCDGVRIEDCVVSGARDAGIYVGQSRRIRIEDSEAYGNVAGIELENSVDAEVARCRAHDNTAGLLIFNLPDLPVQGGRRAKVHDCDLVDNNLPSFAEKGTTVSKVPRGIGLLLLASDDNEIHHNTITGNASAGVVLTHYNPVVFGVTDDAAFDLYCQGNWVHDNTFADNGSDPKGIIALAVEPRPVPDMLWDGCVDPALGESDALVNCFSGNGGATYYDADLCSQPSSPSTDLAPVTCEHDALPFQNP